MVWERIRELKRQEEAKKAQEAADRLREEHKAKAKAQLERDQAIRKTEEARETKRKANKEILESSGVLSEMREIEKGLEGNVRKHAILIDLDAGTATLVWGNKFRIVNDYIDYEKGFLSRGQKDYSYIKISIEISNSLGESSTSATIYSGDSWSGEKISRKQWENNKLLVRDLVARAYLHPTRINKRETPPSKYSSSSSGSSSSECCSH